MDVSYDSHGTSDVDYIALLHQQLFRLRADGFDDKLIEQLLLVQPGDALIEVNGSCGQS